MNTLALYFRYFNGCFMFIANSTNHMSINWCQIICMQAESSGHALNSSWSVVICIWQVKLEHLFMENHFTVCDEVWKFSLEDKHNSKTGKQQSISEQTMLLKLVSRLFKSRELYLQYLCVMTLNNLWEWRPCLAFDFRVFEQQVVQDAYI